MPRNLRDVPIRPLARESSFVKLRSMKCFSEVHLRILDGWSLQDLAKWIHEQGEYTDVQQDSLHDVLVRYRASLPPGEVIAKRMPQVFMKAAEAVEAGIDELFELQRLYVVQMQRIAIDFDTERKINKLLPTMSQEVRTAREILSTITDLKASLGLTPKVLGQVSVDQRVTVDLESKYGNEAVTSVLDNPESRRKLLAVAERMLQLTAKKIEESSVIDVPAEPETT